MQKASNIADPYGGQRYDIQLRALKQETSCCRHSRILIISVNTLDLSELKAIVLDEADEDASWLY